MTQQLETVDLQRAIPVTPHGGDARELGRRITAAHH